MYILSLLSLSLPLCLRLREKYFYHAWCYNGQPIASLWLPPSLVCSPLPLSLHLSLLAVCQSPSLLHLYISIIPCSPESDEGAGQAVNVFPFVCNSLFPPLSLPLSIPLIKALIHRSFYEIYFCFLEGFALNHLSFLSILCSISYSLNIYHIPEFHFSPLSLLFSNLNRIHWGFSLIIHVNLSMFSLTNVKTASQKHNIHKQYLWQ